MFAFLTPFPRQYVRARNNRKEKMAMKNLETVEEWNKNIRQNNEDFGLIHASYAFHNRVIVVNGLLEVIPKGCDLNTLKNLQAKLQEIQKDTQKLIEKLS